jgi:diguanylate cyclase (GGDEF)-like protein
MASGAAAEGLRRGRRKDREMRLQARSKCCGGALVVLDQRRAAAAAERLRSKVEALAIPHPDGVVTVSAGIASVEPNGGVDVTSLLARADKALYEAKESPRNRVIVNRAVSPA